MMQAGLLSWPCSKTDWLSWSLQADCVEVPAEPVSLPRIATPSCVAGGGPAAPAESYVSQAPADAGADKINGRALLAASRLDSREARAGPRAAQSTPRAGKTLLALMWTERRRRLGGERRLVAELVYRERIDGRDD